MCIRDSAQADTRGFNRFILSGAAEVEVDAAGRVLIPDHQKVFAGLKKEVVFAGVSDRVEIWDKERWNTYKALSLIHISEPTRPY